MRFREIAASLRSLGEPSGGDAGCAGGGGGGAACTGITARAAVGAPPAGVPFASRPVTQLWYFSLVVAREMHARTSAVHRSLMHRLTAAPSSSPVTSPRR